MRILVLCLAAERSDDPPKAERHGLRARCASQQPLNLLSKVFKWKRAGYGHRRLLFRCPSDGMHQNKPRGSMKAPAVGLLTILENGLEISPFIKTLSKGHLIETDRLGVTPIDPCPKARPSAKYSRRP